MNEQYKQKPRQEITATINSIFRNTDRNGREYLLIKTDQPDRNKPGDNIAIFCFRLEDRRDQLKEGSKYTFTCEISERADQYSGEVKTTYILVDFLAEDDFLI